MGIAMPLVGFQELIDEAERGGYAVGYFESWSLESLLAVADAAERTGSPVILGFSGIQLPAPERRRRVARGPRRSPPHRSPVGAGLRRAHGRRRAGREHRPGPPARASHGPPRSRTARTASPPRAGPPGLARRDLRGSRRPPGRD